MADLADATGLTAAFTDAPRRLRPRGTGHNPGSIAVDVAVMLTDGGEAIADLPLLRDRAEVFGPVTSTPTAWRLLSGIDRTALKALHTARAAAREVAWIQAAETGRGIPAARAGGRNLPGLVIDIDATLVTCHPRRSRPQPLTCGPCTPEASICAFSVGHPVGRFPSRHFTLNQAWLELSLTATDLLAWTVRM